MFQSTFQKNDETTHLRTLEARPHGYQRISLRKSWMPETEVVLYVVPGCPLCADARTWLRDNKIDFVEKDVASDYSALRRMYRLTRQGLVPVFERNNVALVRPTDDKLKQFLAEES